MNERFSSSSLLGSFASTLIPALAIASTGSLDTQVIEIKASARIARPRLGIDSSTSSEVCASSAEDADLNAVFAAAPVHQRLMAVDIARRIRSTTEALSASERPALSGDIDADGTLVLELSAPKRRLGFRIAGTGQVRWLLVDLDQRPWIEAAGDLSEAQPAELMKRLRMG